MFAFILIIVIGLTVYAVDMVYVKGGTFMMGNDEGEDDEKPVHEVKLSDYYIGKYEVTYREYLEFLNDVNVAADGTYNGHEVVDIISYSILGYKNNHFYIKNDRLARSKDCPVVEVTWWGAVEYCNWLSEKENLAKAYNNNGYYINKNGDIAEEVTEVEGYRLPTEAEWEYAARGGTKSKGYKYAGSNDLDEVGWYWRNSGDKYLTENLEKLDDLELADLIFDNNCRNHPVGEKKSNEIGIYDMSGNAAEWCHDNYYENGYEYHTYKDPCIQDTDLRFVIRGGEWDKEAYICEVSRRDRSSASYSYFALGFRLARSK